MIDIVFPTYNRLEFTVRALDALRRNTNWDLVHRLYVIDDGSDFSRAEIRRACLGCGAPVMIYDAIKPSGPDFSIESGNPPGSGPVAAMLAYLRLSARFRSTPDMFAKVDSDTMMPAGWLDVCLMTMRKHPELDFLGVEALDDIPRDQTAIGADPGWTRRVLSFSYRPSRWIGGIGLMRRSAFELSRPVPRGRFGFTEFQQQREDLVKGFLTPALPVCLLDRVPFEPFRSWNEEYIAKGWARRWPYYEEGNPAHEALWQWFKEQ